MRRLADALWSLGLKRLASVLHRAAALRALAPPATYRLLCTNCAPGDDWYSTYHGPCAQCGRHRNLMALRLVRR